MFIDVENYEKTLDVILKNYYNSSFELVVSASRKEQVVHPRRIATVLLRDYAKLSFPNIAKILRYKDHTTALYHYKRAESKGVNEEILKIAERLSFPDYSQVQNSKPRGTTNFKFRTVYERANYACEVCKFNDVLEVHHIISKKNGGTDLPSNTIVLCPNHHSQLHAGVLYLNPKKFGYLDLQYVSN